MVTQTKSVYGRAFAYGVLGTFIMTVLLVLMRWSGLTQFNISMFLGSMLTLEFNPSTWVAGFIWHLLNGGIFGLIYAAIFKGIGSASSGRGTMLGFVHWLVFSAVLAFSADIHPLIPSELPEPGFFAINYGAITAVGTLALHLVFGYVIGNSLEGVIARNRKIKRSYTRKSYA